MKEHALTFSGGRVKAIYSDELAPIFAALNPDFRKEFAANVRRISDVEPEGDGWVATMRTEPPVKLGPYATRDEALAAEAEWLKRNVL